MAVTYEIVKSQIIGNSHLTTYEKDCLLSITNESGLFDKESGVQGWVDMGASRTGLTSAKQHPVPPERVYKVRGKLRLKTSLEALTESICNPELMKKWDGMVKQVQVLQATNDTEAGVLRLATYSRFGVPGFSYVFYDRDFMVDAFAVKLPCGVYVMCAASTKRAARLDGDPGPQSYVVRGHIGTSGWFLLPHDDGTVTTCMILQVDPMGSVPASVVNFTSSFIPQNLIRMQKLLKSLSPEEVTRLREARLPKYDAVPDFDVESAEGESDPVVAEATGAGKDGADTQMVEGGSRPVADAPHGEGPVLRGRPVEVNA